MTARVWLSHSHFGVISVNETEIVRALSALVNTCVVVGRADRRFERFKRMKIGFCQIRRPNVGKLLLPVPAFLISVDPTARIAAPV